MTAPRQLLDCLDRSNVGRRLRLVPNAGPQAVLDVRGDDAAARAVTVALSIAPTVAVDALGPDDVVARRDELRARAVVEAGVGGHTLKLEVDVGAGVVFAASVSSLRVSVVNDGGAPVEVGAFLGYGSTPSAPPRLTVFPREVGFREPVELEVPDFATSVEVLRPPSTELLVEVALGRSGPRWLYGDRVFFDERMRPLPLANGCRRVRITSLTTGVRFSPVVLFTLAF